MSRFTKACVTATIAGFVYLAAFQASCWLGNRVADPVQHASGAVAFTVSAWFVVWLGTLGHD